MIDKKLSSGSFIIGGLQIFIQIGIFVNKIKKVEFGFEYLLLLCALLLYTSCTF